MTINPSPDAALALLTLGTTLIYWELNRPGSILPGALGLLAALFSFASLYRAGLQPMGVLLVLTATVLLALALHSRLPTIVPVAATLSLILGLFSSVRTPSTSLHAVTSLLCGLTLGTGSAWLAAVAHRARRNKGSACDNQGLD